MSLQRPIYLNLLQIRLPCPGLVSILHRTSGILIFLLLPFLFCLLAASLHEDSFNQIQNWLARPWLRFTIWVILSALTYHLVAGIRHLLMDAGIGENLKIARFSAYLTLIISAILIALLGIWLW